MTAYAVTIRLTPDDFEYLSVNSTALTSPGSLTGFADRFGIFSSNVNDWIATDCTAEEVEEEFAAEFTRDLARRLRDVRRKIQLVDDGDAGKAYHQFAMSYAAASALALHGPECEDEEDDEPVPSH